MLAAEVAALRPAIVRTLACSLEVAENSASVPDALPDLTVK